MNRFVGTLPDEGWLRWHMHIALLADNSFAGAIPNALMLAWRDVQEFDASDNFLEGAEMK
eukprot:1008205-Amphidinium_carterae.1